MENNIMGFVGAFIGIAIMLAIGVQILGNAVQDCSALPGFNTLNSTGDNDPAVPAPGDGSLTFPGGWALQCETNNDQAQSAYTLLIVILVVIAAVAILSVVRML